MSGLRKLLDAATPGPWVAQYPSLLHGPDKGGIDIGPLLAEVYSEADLIAIRALRNSAPNLLAVMEAGRSVMAEWHRLGPTGDVDTAGAHRRLRLALDEFDRHLRGEQ